MSEIMFIMGAALAIMGKVNIANLKAEGPTVRAAGFMLMMPLIVIMFLSFVLGILTGGDVQAMASGLPFILFLQLPVIMICAGVAYTLIRNASTGDFTLGQRKDETPVAPEVEAEPMPVKTQVQQPVEQPLPARGKFPSVMSTAEAARYLNMSEQAILDLITEGKLTAARINYRYKISRTVLDEFIQQRQAGSAAE